MILMAASLLVALAGGYLGMRLLETERVRLFSRNHPALAALTFGLVVVLLAAAVFILRWRLTGEVSLFQLRLFVASSAYLLGVVVPVSIIIRRLGFSGWWAIIAFIPVCQVLGVWLLAIKKWPKREA